jgi:alanyl-tRNA synthetase
VVKAEERQFASTLEEGMDRIRNLIEMLQEKGETEIPGDEAFRLYDSCGLPREMTVEIAQDHGMTVDMEGFEEGLARQRERSRRGAKGLAMHDVSIEWGTPPTEFIGFEATAARVNALDALVDGEFVPSLSVGDEGALVLEATPFYAERGGQVGDTGQITGDDFHFKVTDTQQRGEHVLHIGRVTRGSIEVPAEVTASVDAERRDAIRRHHTATHLLHAALRQEIGEHVRQSGSLVGPDHLRFDFSHHEAIDRDTLARIEERVNEWILADLPVDIEHMDLEEAQDAGAIALFEEQYAESVRTVRVGETSFELCGGIHCCRTGEIGSLRVLSESSVAAGTRRIEAVTGISAVRHSREADESLAALAQALNCPEDEIAERVDAQQERIRELEREVEQARQMSASVNVPDLIADGVEVAGATLVARKLDDADREMLKSLADRIIQQLDSGATVLGSEVGGEVALVAKVSDDLIERGAHAGNLLSEVARRADGGGGGAPRFAQAGGGDPAKLDDAIGAAGDILAGQLEG